MNKAKNIVIIIAAALVALCVGYFLLKVLSYLIMIGFYIAVFAVAYFFIRRYLINNKGDN